MSIHVVMTTVLPITDVIVCQIALEKGGRFPLGCTRRSSRNRNQMQKVFRSPSSGLSEADIRSNALLSDPAQHEARLLLLDAEGEIPLLDIELFNTPIDESHALQMRRAAVVDRIQLYKAAIAPHRAVPNEVLSEIFALCVDVVSVPIDLNTVPWSLARVCVRWKKVVVGTPDVWSNVEVDYQIDWPHSPAVYVNRTLKANKILSLCKNSFISIKILGDLFRSDPTPLIQSMNDLIAPHSTHLKQVTLKCALDFGASFFQLPPGSLQFVDAVDLSFEGPYCVTGKVTVFQNAPKLRKVTWGGGSYASFRPSSFKVPWYQLTHLHLHDAAISTFDAHMMLQQCSQLAECRLPIRKNYSDTREAYMSKNLPPTRLPHLVSLIIELINGLGEFVCGLDLPGLVDLEIIQQLGLKPAEACSEEDLKVDFIPFLRRIQGLQRFCMRQLVPEAIIEPLLYAAPSLVTFALQEGDALPRTTLDLISTGKLIPKVEDISCYVVELNPFLDMVETRGQGPTACSRFRKVFIDLDTNGGGVEYSTRQRVENLNAVGHDITVRG